MMYGFITDDAKVFNVKDIYLSAKDNGRKLLSEYGGDFWAGYKANYQYFDRLFMKKYTSLIPLDQDYEEGVQSIQEDFSYDVYAWLLSNDKRYSELFRINSIPDNAAYSLTNNVDYTESTQRTTNRDIEFNKGAQADSDEGFIAYGQQQIDDDKSKTYGSQQVDEDISRAFASRNDSDTKSTSAYYDTGFAPVDKHDIIQGQHTDTEDNQYVYGQHIDTEDNQLVYGAHRDDKTNLHNEGARKDTTDDDTSEEITMHKVGNMGVQTVDDMLLKHWDNWNLFDFYGLIFEDIAKNLLRGC